MSEIKDENNPNEPDGAAEPPCENSSNPLEPTLEEQLRAELADKHDKLLRLAAEFENFRKTSARDLENRIRFANESLVLSLLPILDNLEQALRTADFDGKDASNSVLIGVKMVVKLMSEVLAKYGVEVFSAAGLPFDPIRHEAVGEKEDASVAVGTVVEEYHRGYLLNGRLLRPARVMVAKAPVEKRD